MQEKIIFSSSFVITYKKTKNLLYIFLIQIFHIKIRIYNSSGDYIHILHMDYTYLYTYFGDSTAITTNTYLYDEVKLCVHNIA